MHSSAHVKPPGRRLALLITAPLAALGLLLAGCGGTRTHTVTHTVTATAKTAIQSACPANRSYMGCGSKTRPGSRLLLPLATAPHGLLFPDVSVWQHNVSWPAVAAWQRAHGWHPTAIFKIGEYTLDSQAARNAAQTKALGFWRAGYWFLRNTGCSHEAALIIWAAHLYGLKVVAEDAEVPEARGYAACITPRLKAAGLIPVEYTAPGTNPDSSNPGVQAEWVASYGPSQPPCLWTCSVGQLGRQSILAFQFTDGTFGSPVTVPGIGRDDVSVDYGLTKLGVPGPKPKPKTYCFGRHYNAKHAAAVCKTIRPLTSQRSRARDATKRALAATNRDLTAHHCRKPYRRAVCVNDGRLADRLVRREKWFAGKVDQALKQYS